jgi:hypothetical protein
MGDKVIDGKQAGIVVYQHWHTTDRRKPGVADRIVAGEPIGDPFELALATRTTKKLLRRFRKS